MSTNVTKSFLPDFETYVAHLRDIWESGWVTNNGPKAQELEQLLARELGAKHVLLLNNGTIAIQIALRAAQVAGEVITTPFSYVATTSSLVWEGMKPVFVDIDPLTCCIDPEKIEAAITPKTTAILAVHVYGFPAAVERIATIARKHNLKVIYDAAHAFGARHLGKSLCNFGDVSTLSFHATKLFHTAEGGAIVTDSDEIAHRASYLRNFGHNGPEAFHGLGINGKSSEIHAAMGLCVLPQVPKIIASRAKVVAAYNSVLNGLPGITRPTVPASLELNHAYYPVIFPSETKLLAVRDALNNKDVFPRRYFFPSLSTLPYVEKQMTPEADSMSKRIMCLPLFFDLPVEHATEIATLVATNL